MKKIISVAITATALLLSGCSQIGAAATIGGTKITQATIQGSVDSILEERTKIDTSSMQLESGEDLNRSQLRFHVFANLLNEIAKKTKIEVSKAEIDTRRASVLNQIGGVAQLPTALVGAGIAPKDLDLYLQSIIISDKLSQALAANGVTQDEIGNAIQRLVIETATQKKISINPRYGVWDAVNGDIIAKDSAGSAVTPSIK